MHRIIPFILAVVTAVTLAVDVQAIDAAIAKVPSGHPRLYLSSDSVVEVRKRLESSPYREVWQRIRRDKDYLYQALTYAINGDFGKLFDLLFRDYETSPKPITDLPLTKYFPSPGGAMVARLR